MKRVKILISAMVIGALLLIPVSGIALADDIDVDIVVVGDNPDVDVEANGSNPTITINGQNIEDIGLPKAVGGSAYWSETNIRRIIYPWIDEASDALNIALEGMSKLIGDFEGLNVAVGSMGTDTTEKFGSQATTIASLRASLLALSGELDSAITAYQNGIASLGVVTQNQISLLESEIAQLKRDAAEAQSDYESDMAIIENALSDLRHDDDTILIYMSVAVGVLVIALGLLTYKVVRIK